MGITQETIYQTVDELRAIASMGMLYTQDGYDRERYERILAIALRLLAELEERPFESLVSEFQEDNWLHMSPAAGAEAVIVQGGKIMLIKRRDNGLWAVPGGFVEVGETLAEAAERELLEETGINGHVTRLLGIFDSRLWHSRTKSQLYHAVFLAESSDPTPKKSIEATDIDFFDEHNLPELSPGHHLRVPLLFKILCGELPAPYFDRSEGKSSDRKPGQM